MMVSRFRSTSRPRPLSPILSVDTDSSSSDYDSVPPAKPSKPRPVSTGRSRQLESEPSTPRRRSVSLTRSTNTTTDLQPPGKSRRSASPSPVNKKQPSRTASRSTGTDGKQKLTDTPSSPSRKSQNKESEAGGGGGGEPPGFIPSRLKQKRQESSDKLCVSSPRSDRMRSSSPRSIDRMRSSSPCARKNSQDAAGDNNLRSSSPSNRKRSTSAIPYSPRVIAAMDRTVLELETQTLARKVEVLTQEKMALKASVELYETRLKSVSNQLRTKDDDAQDLTSMSSSSFRNEKQQDKDIARKETEKVRRDFSDRKLHLEKLRENLAQAGKALISSGQAKDHAYEIHISSVKEQLSFAEQRNLKAEETTRMMHENLARLETQYRAKLAAATTALQGAQAQADALSTDWDKARKEAELKVQETMECKDQINKLRERLHNTSKELMDLKRKNTKLEEERNQQQSSFQEMISNFEAELAEAKKVLAKMEIKLEEKDRECEKEVEKAKQQVVSAQKELADIKTEREQDTEVLMEQLRQAQAKTKEAESKIAEKEQEIVSLTEELATTQAKCKKSEAKAAAMKEKLEATAKKHEEYRVQIFNLKRGMSATSLKEEAAVQERVESILAHKEEEFRIQLLAAQEKERETKQKLEVLQSKLNASRSKSSSADENEEDLAELRGQCEAMTKRQNEYRNQIHTLMTELQTCQSTNRKNEAALEEMETKVRIMTAEQEVDKKALMEQKETARDLTARISTLSAELAEAHSKNEEYQEEISELQARVNVLARSTNKFSDAEEHEVEILRKLETITKQYEDSKKRVAELEWEVSEFETMTKRQTEYRNQIQSLTADLSTAHSRIEQSQREIADMDNKMRALAEEREDDKKSIASKLIEVTELKTQVSTLMTELSEAQAKQKKEQEEIAEMRGKIEMTAVTSKASEEGLRQKLEAITKHHEESIARIAVLESQLSHAHEKEAELREELETSTKKLKKEADERVVSLEVKLSATENSLKKQEQKGAALKEEMGLLARQQKEYESKMCVLMADLSAARSSATASTEEIAKMQNMIDKDKVLLETKQRIIADLTARLDCGFGTKHLADGRNNIGVQESFSPADGDQRLKSALEQLSQATHRHAEQLAQKESECQARLAEQQQHYQGLKIKLEERAKNLAEEVKTLQDQLSQLKAARMALQREVKRADDLDEEVKLMKSHLGMLEEERNALQSDLEKRAREGYSTASQMEELTQQIKRKDKAIEELEDLLTETETRGVCIQSGFEHSMQTKDEKLAALEEELMQTKQARYGQLWPLILFAFWGVFVSVVAAAKYYEAKLPFEDLFNIPVDLGSLPKDVRVARCSQIVKLLPYCLNHQAHQAPVSASTFTPLG